MTNPTDAQIAGWKTLDAMGLSTKEALANRNRQRETQLELFAAVFGSEAGRKVLEIMKGWTVGRPMVPDGVAQQQPLTFEQIAPYVVHRQGQNSIVKLIIDILAEAEKGPAQPRGK